MRSMKLRNLPRRLVGGVLWGLLLILPLQGVRAAKEYKRVLVVALDGSGDYTSLNQAMEGIRAFMDYRVTVHIRKGIYREK